MKLVGHMLDHVLDHMIIGLVTTVLHNLLLLDPYDNAIDNVNSCLYIV